MNIWKEFSFNYIKKNKAASISILIAAFISSTLLSLTCGIFYNIWTSDIQQIKIKEGGWQGKLVGDITSEDVTFLENHSNIKTVELLDSSNTQEKTAVLTFYHPRNIYIVLPQLAEHIGIDTDKNMVIIYHEKLLEKYFIYPRGKVDIPLIFFAYLIIQVTACLSLILIIHNAFGVSMNARLHQLGILQSIGATPKQLHTILMQEAILLCLLPILSGAVAGALLSNTFIKFLEHTTSSVRDYDLEFRYHPMIYLAAIIVSLITVWFSARIPAKKISRLSPLEAIRYVSEKPVTNMKSFLLITYLFGIEGELARKSLYIRRKAFRTATISLMLSFFAFCTFLNLETISRLSTKYTYFERYKNSWDLMLSFAEDTRDNGGLLDSIKSIPGVKSCIAYKKAEAYTYLSKDMLSPELLAIGSINSLMNTGHPKENGKYVVKVPLLILDDESFISYNKKSKPLSSQITDHGDVITVNAIWDNINSSRREKKMIPFISDKVTALELFTDDRKEGDGGDSFSVNIASEAKELPNLREEFSDSSLVLIMPQSTYKDYVEYLPARGNYFTIQADSDEKTNSIQQKLLELLSGRKDYKLENRLEEEKNDIAIRHAYKIVMGGLAGLIGIIGIANVLSNTIGYLPQRKREFARYLTGGLSPRGLMKILFVEASILGVKPILVSLLINIPLVIYGLHEALIKPMDFIINMPILPIFVFAAIILFTIGISYYLGGRKLLRVNLIEALKEDTMV